MTFSKQETNLLQNENLNKAQSKKRAKNTG